METKLEKSSSVARQRISYKENSAYEQKNKYFNMAAFVHILHFETLKSLVTFLL